MTYLWLDATYLKVREDGRVQSMALVVAIGVREDGEREVLGLDVGPSEEAAFWLAFLRSLVERGLRGVKLVISDAHVGVKEVWRGSTRRSNGGPMWWNLPQSTGRPTSRRGAPYRLALAETDIAS